MPNLEVKLFTTGGTIDGADLDKGTKAQSDAAKYLKSQPGVTVFSEALLNKDSRQMMQADRNAIVEAVTRCHNQAIIVTHGTFTIAETGRILKRVLSDSRRTVLLVGAWIPFGDENSDAPSQMEFALEVLRSGRPGVWIAMDGRLWDPDIIEKREVNPGKFKFVEAGPLN